MDDLFSVSHTCTSRGSRMLATSVTLPSCEMSVTCGNVQCTVTTGQKLRNSWSCFM